MRVVETIKEAVQWLISLQAQPSDKSVVGFLTSF